MRPIAPRPLLFAALTLLIAACGDDVTSDVVSYVQASDQSPAPPHDTVVVDTIVAAEAGWLVVYQDANGGYGRQLGHTSINSGTSTQVSVTLSRTSVDGETLHALLHVDHGQDGDFEFPGADEPVLTEAGDPVAASFIVTVADQTLPSLQVENQTLTAANQIALTQVVATAAGRVVIRAQTNNAPGDIIGSLDIEAGVTGEDGSPALVTLNRDANNGELLYAVLQRLVGQATGSDVDSDYEDEFDLLSNGPLMVLFTVSVEPPPPITDDATTEGDVTASEDIGPSEDAATAEDVAPVEDTTAEDVTAEDVGPNVEDAEADDAAEEQDTEETEDAGTLDADAPDTTEDDAEETDTEDEDVEACAPIADCGDLACGELSDGCGGTLMCGTCPDGEACTDGACEPTTSGFLCDATYADCTEENFAANDLTDEADTIAISMVAFSPYTPTCLRLKVGQTVTIAATASHPFKKVCAEDAVMDSQDGQTSQVEFTMTTPGYYNYKCQFHSSMVGNIQVVP